jgi:hypothetical protein
VTESGLRVFSTWKNEEGRGGFSSQSLIFSEGKLKKSQNEEKKICSHFFLYRFFIFINYQIFFESIVKAWLISKKPKGGVHLWIFHGTKLHTPFEEGFSNKYNFFLLDIFCYLKRYVKQQNSLLKNIIFFTFISFPSKLYFSSSIGKIKKRLISPPPRKKNNFYSLFSMQKTHVI